jgi:hypothetical protein
MQALSNHDRKTNKGRVFQGTSGASPTNDCKEECYGDDKTDNKAKQLGSCGAHELAVNVQGFRADRGDCHGPAEVGKNFAEIVIAGGTSVAVARGHLVWLGFYSVAQNFGLSSSHYRYRPRLNPGPPAPPAWPPNARPFLLPQEYPQDVHTSFQVPTDVMRIHSFLALT